MADRAWLQSQREKLYTTSFTSTEPWFILQSPLPEFQREVDIANCIHDWEIPRFLEVCYYQEADNIIEMACGKCGHQQLFIILPAQRIDPSIELKNG